MEIRCRNIDRTPTYEMRKFCIVCAFIEVTQYFFRQVIRIEPHQLEWDGNYQFPGVYPFLLGKRFVLQCGISADGCILVGVQRSFDIA